MKRIIYPVISCLLLFSFDILAAPVLGEKHKHKIKDQYIIVLKDNSLKQSTTEQKFARHGAKVLRKYKHALNGYSIRLPQIKIKELANDPGVAYIEADRIVRHHTVQTSATWGLDRIDQRDLPLDSNYTYNLSSAGINVYVIDTGIRRTHAQFEGRAYSAYSSINDGRGSDDCDGHGTHVAGTIGGVDYGVAKQASLYAVRVLDCTGSGTLSGVIAGIDWVTANHSKPAVANMSLGSGGSRSLDNATRNSIAAGVTYVVAAGNENDDACLYSPARVTEAITVGATTRTDARASFSNMGACVDVFAPGVSITSAALSSDTASKGMSGTSMASPHVAGIAALYLASAPAAKPAEVAEAISDTATAGHLTNLDAASPNLLAYALLAADIGNDVVKCPTGFEQFNNSLLADGDYQYEPNGSYYYSTTGLHNASLAAKSGTDFDLYLWKWISGTGWVTVARSLGQESNETIQYNGASGYYVWRVSSYRGSGAYQLCLSRP